MVHAQAAHMINIYELGDATKTSEVNGNGVTMEVDKISENGKDEGEGSNSEVKFSIIFNRFIVTDTIYLTLIHIQFNYNNTQKNSSSKTFSRQ